jgi:thioesterase domain-containing protein
LREAGWIYQSLIQVQPGNAGIPPMFFVQARVGYRALAIELGPDRPVYVVPYDDLLVSDTERSLRDIAAQLARRIRVRQPHGPYHLGGWCLAARVAFAIADELCREGEEVALLAVIDMSAPGYSRLTRPPAVGSITGRLRWHAPYVLRGSREERIDWVLGVCRALNWQTRYRSWQLARSTFRRLGRPLPRSLRNVSRLTAEAADKEAITSYPGRITLFRPNERRFVRSGEWDLGWGRIATGGVDVYEIPGLKRTLLRANAAEVGNQLRKCLTRTRESGSMA